MAYENIVIQIDRRRRRAHVPGSDSFAVQGIKVGGDSGTEINGTNVVTNDNTATLTNKTFDVDGTGNSLSNIANANIKAAAGIVESKLALDYSTSGLNTAITNHVGDTANPHSVTAQQVTSVYVPTNYARTQVAAEGNDKVSAHLRGVDNALGAISTGIDWQPFTKTITADAGLNAAADDTALSTLLPFSDDEGTQMIISDFAGGDYLLSVNTSGSDKRFLIWDDSGTLRVTTSGVAQPALGYTYTVANDLIDSPDAQENSSIYTYNGTDLIKIGDVDFSVADGINLSATYAIAGSTTVEPAGGDSVETAISKLHAGALGDDAITTRIIAPGAVGSTELGATSVIAAKLGNDVAGNGLTGGNGSAIAAQADSTGGSNLGTVVDVNSNGIAVKIDDTTVGENGSNQLEVKDLGISTGKLAATSVTAAKLGNDVAGNGLTGGNGSALAVQEDTTGGANLATVVNVSANGVAILVDATTISENGSGQLYIPDSGISANQLNSDAVTKAKVANDAIGGAEFLLENDTFLRARNNADDGDVNTFKVNTSDNVEMASLWYTPASAPTQDYQVSNKKYVDDSLLGIKVRAYTASGWSGGSGSQAVKGDIGFVDTDGLVKPAGAGTTDIYKKRLVICYDATIDNSSSGNWIALPSVSVGSASGGGTLTVGEEVYLSSTAGQISQTITSISSGHAIIFLGYATAASDWEFFRPEYLGDA